jgi:adenylate cyclase
MDSDGPDVRVQFEPGGHVIRVPRGTILLDATRRAGLPIAYACDLEGLCARCDLEILEGGAGLSAPSAREQRSKHDNGVASSHRLACLVRLECDVVVRATYW